MNRLIWYVKQLFKLQYFSQYSSGENKYVCTWRMWLGKCYDVNEYQI